MQPHQAHKTPRGAQCDFTHFNSAGPAGVTIVGILLSSSRTPPRAAAWLPWRRFFLIASGTGDQHIAQNERQPLRCRTISLVGHLRQKASIASAAQCRLLVR
jgi:hypothetical protein